MSLLENGFTTTIANGQQLSAAVDLAQFTLCGLFIPAAFTGTTVTFYACATLSGTYLEVQDGAGAAYSRTVAASKFIPIDPSLFCGVRYLKIKSGTAEGGARSLGLSGRIL